MGLIKANSASVSSSAIFSLADIEQQARAMLARAKAQADQLLAQAQQQADAMRAAALKEGKAAGLEQGRREGHKQAFDQAMQQGKAQALSEQKAKLTETATAMANAATQLEARLTTIDDVVRSDLIRLAIAIATRVTRVTANANPAVVEANVREAVRLTMDKSSIRIAIHPAQRGQLQELLPQLKVDWPTMRHVELVDDDSVGVGGCRVTSATGEVDAAIDAQIERIAAELAPSPPDKGHA